MQTSEWLNRVAYSYDKQFHLRDLVAPFDWHFDLATELLSFGTQYRWHTQLLGTESESAGTWLWAWANTASQIPDHLLNAVRTLKAFGYTILGPDSGDLACGMKGAGRMTEPAAIVEALCK